jgi:hypothetical protein
MASNTETKPRKRARRDVETMEFLSAAKRFLRAAARRVADSDEPELRELLEMEAVLKEAIQAAVDGQRARGNSWDYIAQATGKTRQAAFQRWGKGKKN